MTGKFHASQRPKTALFLCFLVSHGLKRLYMKRQEKDDMSAWAGVRGTPAVKYDLQHVKSEMSLREMKYALRACFDYLV